MGTTFIQEYEGFRLEFAMPKNGFPKRHLFYVSTGGKPFRFFWVPEDLEHPMFGRITDNRHLKLPRRIRISFEAGIAESIAYLNGFQTRELGILNLVYTYSKRNRKKYFEKAKEGDFVVPGIDSRTGVLEVVLVDV